MCQRVTCKNCGKPTYAGCGRHIEAVLGDVPREARCRCRETASKPEPRATGRSSWFASLLGKSGERRT